MRITVNRARRYDEARMMATDMTEYIPGMEICKTTIEWVPGEFDGECKWMWELASALLNCIAFTQTHELNAKWHVDSYLKTLPPEAQALLLLVMDK